MTMEKEKVLYQRSLKFKKAGNMKSYQLQVRELTKKSFFNTGSELKMI